LDRCPDIPFIFVSGTLGEEVAIEALKIGATDYVLKTRLSRLVPSVHRALREARDRSERKRTAEALRQSENYLTAAQKLSRTGSFGWDLASGRIIWSEDIFPIFECDPRTAPTVELVVKRTHPDDRVRLQQVIDDAITKEKAFDIEHRLLLPSGSIKHLRVLAHRSTPEENGEVQFVGAVTDITERKNAVEALRESEERFRTMADALPEVMWITAIEPEKVLYCNPSFERIGASGRGILENPGCGRGDSSRRQDRIVSLFTRWIW
jgi:PAS domain-containing protein